MIKKKNILIFAVISALLCLLIISYYHDSSNVAASINTIHISVIIAGHDACRKALPFLKSLLFHRDTHLTLHVITDKAGYTTLSVLFNTWSIENLHIEFYNADIWTNELSIIPNTHHSGVYGLMKILVDKILPLEIDKIIMLDNDIIVIDSLLSLWKLFDEMNAKQLIGLVENLSNYYLEGPFFECAIERGFNTGVMLMNLKKMRETGWEGMWSSSNDKLINLVGKIKQADQDIINFVLVENPKLVYTLPCVWNYQISAKSLASKLCPMYIHIKPKIIHWNSPLKQNLNTALARSVRGFYTTYFNLDGKAVRTMLKEEESLNNNLDNNILLSDTNNLCHQFLVSGKRKYRTHPFYIPNIIKPQFDDITLVIQLSFQRLLLLEKLVTHWNSPISIVIYVLDYELEAVTNFIQQSRILSVRKNIAYHLVYREDQFYPINYLRNIALNFSLTDAVFISDVDFLFMKNLDEVLRKWQNVEFENNSKKLAFIIPAFETQQYKFDFPKDKNSLAKMRNEGIVDSFRHLEWLRGHSPTKYEYWWKASAPYKVEWEMDFEPYVFLPRKAPLFDPRFVGFGWNKVSYIIELDIQGYIFLVLPDAYIVHLPHSPSLDILQYRENADYRACLQEIKETFLQDLLKNYGTKALKYVKEEI